MVTGRELEPQNCVHLSQFWSSNPRAVSPILVLLLLLMPMIYFVSANITFTPPDSIHCTKPGEILLVQPCSVFSFFISKRYTWSAQRQRHET